MNIGRGKQIHMQSIVSSRLIFWKHLHFCQYCVVWLEVRYNEDLEAPFFCNLHMLEVGQQERTRSKAVNKQITEWGDVSTASCLHTGLTAHRCVRALRLGLLKWSHMIPHFDPACCCWTHGAPNPKPVQYTNTNCMLCWIWPVLTGVSAAVRGQERLRSSRA